MEVYTMHNYTFPTIANISETHENLVRTALCCSPCLSHWGGGPAKHMAAQALLLAYIHIHTAIGDLVTTTAVVRFNPNSAYCGPRLAPYKHAVRSGERAGRAGVGAAILPLRTSNS